MKKQIKKGNTIFHLKVNNWNKQSRRNQDRALMFMYRVLYELDANREFGYSDNFTAKDN
jgi:hypothetical protein